MEHISIIFTMKFSHSFLFLLWTTHIFDFTTLSNVINTRQLASLCTTFWIVVLDTPRCKIRLAKNFFVHRELDNTPNLILWCS
jgi:hypothetical protein